MLFLSWRWKIATEQIRFNTGNRFNIIKYNVGGDTMCFPGCVPLVFFFLWFPFYLIRTHPPVLDNGKISSEIFRGLPPGVCLDTRFFIKFPNRDHTVRHKPLDFQAYFFIQYNMYIYRAQTDFSHTQRSRIMSLRTTEDLH